MFAPSTLWKLLAGTAAALALQAHAFEIFALGTSNTNCKNANQAYTTTLNRLLSMRAMAGHVINGGVDGDKPVWMLNRLKTALAATPDIKLVIFEPGPNERSKKWNLEPSAEILDFLKVRGIPVLYVSHSLLQTEAEAAEFAKSHDAHYYGHWNMGVPTDREHRQYDQPGSPGHMTALGCERWANTLFPVLEKLLKDSRIE
jgi:ADP-heptose:LPS heptosyltransferase